MMTHRLKLTPGASAAICLCVALAACNSVGEPPVTSLEQSYASPTAQMTALSTPSSKVAAPAQAMVSLPAEAGVVGSTRQREYVDGFRQDIPLKGGPKTSGQNGLVVIARTVRRATLDEATPLYKPTEDAIRSELKREFPRVTMKVVERPSSNLYGPYGLALGRGEGTTHCVYMWQWIDENRLPRDAGVLGPVSLRVRLCKADATFDAMAGWLDQLAIRKASDVVASADAAPAVDAPPVDPEKPVAKKRRSRKASHPRHKADPHRETAAAAPSLVPPSTGEIEATPAPLATDLPPQALLGPKATIATRRN